MSTESQNGFSSANMNYAFYHEYFDILPANSNDLNNVNYQDKTKSLFSFEFQTNEKSLEVLRNEKGFFGFSLDTAYPGLTMGLGYAHAADGRNAIKCGFSFDYTTGLPVIPGSTLKGVLRSCFPEKSGNEDIRMQKAQYINDIWEKVTGRSAFSEAEILKLKELVFENGIIFLGAYPVLRGGNKLIEQEYITPHKEITKNPIPISILKVKPGIKYQFCFLAPAQWNSDVSKEDLCVLFRQIILDMGIGAKTNVGFGKFTETTTSAN